MSLTYGKVKGPGFKPVDIRCPHCFGTGQEPKAGTWAALMSCIVCDGTGLRSVAARRILSGEIVRDENGEWIEPNAWIVPEEPGYPPQSWPGL